MTATWLHRNTAISLLGCLALLLAACGPAPATSSTPSPTVGGTTSAAPQGRTINIAAIKATVCAPVLLYEKFLPPQYKVNIAYFTAPADQANQMVLGQMDVACTGITIAAVANEKGQPITVVADLAEKGTAIIVPVGSSIQTIDQLRGKKIGYFPQSIHDVLMRETLRKAGIDPAKDVTLVRVNLTDMPAALQRGDIDAFVGNEPNSTITVMRGTGRVLLYPYDNPVGTINAGILSTSTLAQKEPALLQAVVTAHAKAVDELNSNQGAWADLVSQNWGFDRQATFNSFGNINLNWRITDQWVQQYQVLADRLLEIGLLSGKVEVAKFVDRQFVNKVQP